MIRFLLNLGISLVVAAIALLVAGSLVQGVEVSASGFLLAVGIFALAQAVLSPFVFNVARKHASAVLGGVGLVSTLLALWVATLFPGGLEIHGAQAWVLTPLVVWIVTALGTWLLGAFIVRRWWDRKQAAKKIRSATAS